MDSHALAWTRCCLMEGMSPGAICFQHADLAHRPKHEARHVGTRFDRGPMALPPSRYWNDTISPLPLSEPRVSTWLPPTRALAVTSPSVRLSAASLPRPSRPSTKILPEKPPITTRRLKQTLIGSRGPFRPRVAPVQEHKVKTPNSFQFSPANASSARG